MALRLGQAIHNPIEEVLRQGNPRTPMPTAAEMATARGAVQSAAACGAAVDRASAATLVDEALGLGDVEAEALAARLADDAFFPAIGTAVASSRRPPDSGG